MKQGEMSFWRFIMHLLGDERGEAGKLPDDLQGEVDDLSDEERETLGIEEEEEEETDEERVVREERETEEAAAAKEKEEAEAGAAVAAEKDDDDITPNAQKRIDKVIFEREDTKRTFQEKIDLLKRDPKAYFEKYPDEKPEEKPAKVGAGFEITMDHVVETEDPNHPYNGLTLKQIQDDHGDTAFVQQLINRETFAHRDEIVEKRVKDEADDKALRDESDQEINDFIGRMAKERFDIEDVGELKEDQKTEIDKEVGDTLAWMEDQRVKHGKQYGLIPFEEVYFIKNKEAILKVAAGKGSKDVLKVLTKSSVANVSARKGVGISTGYEADMNLSAQEMADKIDNMGDEQWSKYSAKAPRALKEKFPQADW